MYSIKALSLLLLVGAATAQYNYNKPQAPKNTYLPPSPATSRPILSQEQINAEGLNPDGEHEPGMPFDFTYAVKEDDGNDFSHQAQSDGDVVKGEYRILLPDGRTQVVKYTADWKNGYNAEVTFEGEAVYPDPAPTRAPQPRPQPQPTNRPPPPPPRPQTTYRPAPPPPPRPQTTYRPAPPTQRPQTQAPYRPQPTSPPRPQPPQQTYRPSPPAPRPVQTTRNPYENEEDNDSQGLRPTPTQGYNYQPPPTTRRPPPPPPQTTRRPAPPPARPPPPVEPVGLYGTPNQPFGVRNHPKFGYSK